ncbi:MBL fold metallo-hydrolase [Patescibacteria group bacterium]|nr:MBL fold metallo-hydrolase [Patescibacteria group bacterium]
MEDQFMRRRKIGLAIVAAVTVLLWLPLLPFTQGVARSAGAEGELTVAFLAVGQGDGIFIETPEGIQVLIDGGPDATVLRSLGDVMSIGDRAIDVVVGTHPDKDHVAGLVDVLARYRVAQVIRTENINDTAPSEAFNRAVETEGAQVTYARAGQVWQLGASTTLTILSPAANPKEWESNAASIVALLRYGQTEFLLTGDAGEGTEHYLVERYGATLESDVLKLGHHGSRTSSSEIFMKTVAPRYAVVSAGKDNDYGHPHSEVVERVEAVSASLVSTAERGTLVFRSDGKTVQLIP